MRDSEANQTKTTERKPPGIKSADFFPAQSPRAAGRSAELQPARRGVSGAWPQQPSSAPPRRLIRTRGAAGCERASALDWSRCRRRRRRRSRSRSRRPRRLRAALSRRAAGRCRGRPERAPGREPRAFVRAPRWVRLAHLLCTQRLGARGRPVPAGATARPTGRPPCSDPRREGPPGGKGRRASPPRGRRWAGVPACAGGRRAGRWACGEPGPPRAVPGTSPGCGVGAWQGSRAGVAESRGCRGWWGAAREASLRGRSARLIVASSALKMERPCLERGCAAHRVRRARPDAEPWAAGSPPAAPTAAEPPPPGQTEDGPRGL